MGSGASLDFVTNNRQWSAQTITNLYKARWQIEVFFKQIKQTLKLTDFLDGTSCLCITPVFESNEFLVP